MSGFQDAPRASPRQRCRAETFLQTYRLNPQENTMKNRPLRICAAVASAVALCSATLGVTQASAGRPKASPTLNVLSTTLVQTGPAQGTAGSQYTFYDADSGGDHGHDYWTCAATNAQGDGICNGLFVLSRGTISAVTEGNLNTPTFQATGTITGGTGAYAGARGEIVAGGTLAATPFTFYFDQNGS
jgi:hypothetical protein